MRKRIKSLSPLEGRIVKKVSVARNVVKIDTHDGLKFELVALTGWGLPEIWMYKEDGK